MTIRDIIGFDWDQANREKSWLRHAIKWSESEQVFFNEPIFVFPDVTHSASEDRFHALGKTNVGKLLFFRLALTSLIILRLILMSNQVKLYGLLFPKLIIWVQILFLLGNSIGK